MNDNKIRCEAKNCIYHSKQNNCTAEHIEVGNSTACKCGETACNTFKLNDKSVKG